ncbi:MAG: fatty acid desaturase, partial [Alphaproteobacteria bacterium]
MTPVLARRDRPWRRLELPTWGVAAGVYGGWGLVTWSYESLPWWLILPLGAWLVCWQGSLQHEALHGHPTRRPWLNALLGLPALWLWLPYLVYRESHLIHHRDAELTCPVHDPEAFYLMPETWARLGPVRRAFFALHNTLAGRLVFGPALASYRLWRDEVGLLVRGDLRHLGAWLVHLPVVAGVLAWANLVCGIPVWAYVAFFAYPGVSLTMLRSFAEHRAAREVPHRTAIVEAGPLMSLLYLNNNLHAAHHAAADVPWYDLPRLYRKDRTKILERNGGYHFRGYGEQARRFFLRMNDAPLHPFVGVWHPEGP